MPHSAQVRKQGGRFVHFRRPKNMTWNSRLIEIALLMGAAVFFHPLASVSPVTLAEDTPLLVRTPSYSNLTPCLAVPPFLEDRLIYYNSFDSPDENPEVNVIGAQALGKVTAGFPGMVGRSAGVGKNSAALHLRSSAFSPHRPLTVSFWWALQEDAKVDGSFGLFHLANGPGFVSHFSRGRGDWCALQRPAGVLQVYHLPGIANVNGIHDYDLMSHLELKAGVWHHTALTFSSGSVVILYTDGRPSYTVHLRGRGFNEADGLHDLTLGIAQGTPMWMDEVLILQRVLTADEIAEYVRILTSMRQVSYPAPETPPR
jgi:hypothetical protein